MATTSQHTNLHGTGWRAGSYTTCTGTGTCVQVVKESAHQLPAVHETHSMPGPHNLAPLPKLDVKFGEIAAHAWQDLLPRRGTGPLWALGTIWLDLASNRPHDIWPERAQYWGCDCAAHNMDCSLENHKKQCSDNYCVLQRMLMIGP